MSTALHAFRRLAARFQARRAATPDPDSMSLHDWADLPPHHPPSRPRAVLRPQSGR